MGDLYLTDLAAFLRVPLGQVEGFEPHLDLAQALVAEQIGDEPTWSPTARAIILTAVARAYYNPEGLRSETKGPFTAVRDAAALGIYLTDDEITRLHRTPGVPAPGGPRGSFPAARDWPDPIERALSD